MARGQKGVAAASAKTKLCVFDRFHTCKKGNACSFAHGQAELAPPLDPAPPRPRPAARPSGMGGDGERGRGGAGGNGWQSRIGSNGVQVNCKIPGIVNTATAKDMPQGDSGSDTTEYASSFGESFLGSLSLEVKNTFLTLDEPPAPDAGIRRSASAPALLGGNSLRATSTDPLGLLPGSPASHRDSDLGHPSDSNKCSRGQLSDTSLSSTSTLKSGETVPDGPQTFQHRRLFKTRMCAYHAVRKCTKGADCTFAHSKKELLPRPEALESRSQIWATGGAARPSGYGSVAPAPPAVYPFPGTFGMVAVLPWEAYSIPEVPITFAWELL